MNARLPVQEADRREAEEMQSHDDDGDAGDDCELVRIKAHQRADHARAGAERHEYRREPGDEQDGRDDGVAFHQRRRLILRQPLERGAGQINEIGRHQRQHAGRQKAHEAGKERGEDGDGGDHAPKYGAFAPLSKPPIPVSLGCDGAVIWSHKLTAVTLERCRRGGMAQRNLITDVAGVLVGHADEARLASGVTAIVFEEPAVAAVDVRGGAPGTRETDLLEPHRTIERIDAGVLSGGSAFGLDAGTGVQALLRERGRGFAIGDTRVPIVCGAVLFDLLNGGDKNWGRFPPYRDLGYAAAARAGKTFALGTAGAGFGATTGNLKGGLGSALAATPEGATACAVGACAAVGGGRDVWGAPFEVDGEFGGLGFPPTVPPAALTPNAKGRPGENTTIALVATDAALSKAQAKEFAIIAQDGLARAIYPAHTTLDGDTVFAGATGRRPLADAVNE